MKKLLFWLTLLTAVLTTAHAQDPAPNDPNAPWDRSGTAAGAMINGVQSSLQRAELGGTNTAITPLSVAKRYNETYGPFLNKIGFDMTKFMGTPQRRGVIFWLIKAGFVIALMLTFVRVAFLANKSQASISDLGWSMSKTGIAAIVVFFPGGIYALIIMLPVALAASFAHSGADATLDPNSTVAMRAENAMDDGIAAAEAVMNGAMASCSQQSTEDYQTAYSLAEAVKALATSAHLPASVVNTITLPPKGQNGEINVQSIQRGDLLLTKQKFRIVLHETIALWKDWPQPQIADIKKIQTEGEKALSLCTVDAEKTAAELRRMRLAAYHAMLPLLKDLILRRQAVSGQPNTLPPPTDENGVAVPVIPASAIDRDAERLFAAGQVRAAPFLEANREARSTGETVINRVSNFMLGFLMPAIGAVWMFTLEILMIQLLIMAAFWIHPKTEASAVKAAKMMLGVAFFLPLYLIAFLAVQKLLGVLMPGTPISTNSATGIVAGVLSTVSNLVNVLTWPMRAMFAVIYAILSPLLAIPCAWMMLKTLKSGGTILGGMAKKALTSAGAIATMSMPLLRGATMAAGAGLSAAAGGMAASAAASPGGAGKPLLKGAAWATRMAARAADATEDTMGKAFGVNDKYMNRTMTAEQNRKGAFAAMKAAAGGSLSAAMSGGRASDIISHVEGKGREHELLRAKAAAGGDGAGHVSPKTSASDTQLVEAQRQQAAATSKAADRIGEFVEKLDRVNASHAAAAATVKKPEEPPPAASLSHTAGPTPPPITPTAAAAEVPIRLRVEVDAQAPAAIAARARVSMPGEAVPRVPSDMPPPPRINLADFAGRN